MIESEPRSGVIIDAWAQHPTLRHLHDPMFEPLRRWTKGALPTTELPLAATLAAMDHAGVSRSLLSAWVGPHGVLISNDEVAAWVAQAPDRLVGVGSVDIRKGMAAVREVRRCIEQLGFKAIRVLPWLWEAPPTDRRFYPVYVACCELGVPFCTQIGHTGPLMPSEVGRPIYLDQVAIDFPELVIVGGHIGYPWTDEAIAIATKHENLYIKVLFGSNYPMILPSKALDGFEALGLDEQAKALFLAENARRVYQLGE
jgi:hypothetical protein